jgi:hypothetical protein
MWVVYDHPTDFPNNFVARCWLGEEASGDIIVSPDITALREVLAIKGLYRLERQEGDDPIIMEVWL